MTEVALINGERKAIYYILGQVVIHEKKKKGNQALASQYTQNIILC